MTHECRHEAEFINIRDEFKEIKDCNKTLNETAKSHIEKAHFFWMAGIFIAILSSILVNMDNKIKQVDEAHSERMLALENKTNDNALSTARIETQLAQIQKDLSELKILINKKYEKGI